MRAKKRRESGRESNRAPEEKIYITKPGRWGGEMNVERAAGFFFLGGGKVMDLGKSWMMAPRGGGG